MSGVVQRSVLEMQPNELQRLEGARGTALTKLTQLQEWVKQDVLKVPHETASTKAAFKTKSTVGIIVMDTTIENMVVGGPAYNSQKLDKGDIILKIDGVDASRDNCAELLSGSDIPGSNVTITVKKGFANTIDVTLTRMASSVIADRRMLFEHFTKMKDDAAKLKGTTMSAQVDAVINLWTNMTIAEAKHERKVTENVHRAQEETQKRIDELSKALDELRVRFKEPSNATVGVGLVMNQIQRSDNTFEYIVERTVEGSPAQWSGVILPGDVLESIAGIKVENMSQEDMASLITGPEGSKVTAKFLKKTLSTSREHEVSVDLVRSAPKVGDDGGVVLKVIARLQDEAALLREEITALEEQTQQFENSRGQFSRKCQDAVDARGKAEREALSNKQALERCYMVAKGESADSRVPPAVVDMSAMQLTNGVIAKLSEVTAQARSLSESNRRMEKDLTQAKEQRDAAIRSHNDEVERVRTTLLQCEQQVLQAEQAAQERIARVETDNSEAARQAVAKAQAECNKLNAASTEAMNAAVIKAQDAKEAMQASKAEMAKAAEIAAGAKKHVDMVAAQNLQLRQQLSAVLEAAHRMHMSLCKPRGAPTGGLGLKVEENNGTGPVVAELVQGGVASQTGGKIQLGDLLDKIDGQSMVNEPIDKVRGMIIGPACTPVELEFVRPGAEGYHLKLVRSGGDDTKDGNVRAYADLLAKELCEEAKVQLGRSAQLVKDFAELKGTSEKEQERLAGKAAASAAALKSTEEELRRIKGVHAECPNTLNDALEAVKGKEEELARAKGEVDRTKKELAEAQKSVSEGQAALTKSRGETSKAVKDNGVLVGQNDTLKIEVEMLKKDWQRVSEEVVEERKQKALLSRQMGEESKEVARLNGEVARFHKEISAHPKEIADAKGLQQTAEIKADRAGKLADKVAGELDAERKAVVELNGRVKSLQAELERDAERYANAVRRVSFLEGEMKRVTGENTELEKRLGACMQEIKLLTQSTKDLTKRCDEAKKVAEAATKEAQAAKALASETNELLASTEATARRMMDERNDLKHRLDAAVAKEMALRDECAILTKHLGTLHRVQDDNVQITADAQRMREAIASAEESLKASLQREDYAKSQTQHALLELDAANGAHYVLAMEYAGAVEQGIALVGAMFGPEVCGQASSVGISLDKGVVQRVDKGSPADGKVTQGDVLLSVNGKDVAGLADHFVSSTLLGGPNGSVVTIVTKEAKTGLKKTVTMMRTVPGQEPVKSMVDKAVKRARETLLELDGAKAQMASMQTLAQQVEQRMQSTEILSKSREKSAQTFQSNLAELMEAHSRLKEEHKAQEVRHAKREEDLEAKLRAAYQEVDAVKAQANAAKQAFTEAVVECKETSAQAAAKEKKLSAEIEALQAAQMRLVSEDKVLRASAQAAEKEAMDAREVSKNLRKEIEDIRRELAVINGQLVHAREQVGTAQGRIKAHEEAAASAYEKQEMLMRKIAETDKQREALKLECERSAWENKTLQGDVAAAKTQQKIIRDEANRVEVELIKSRDLLETLTRTSNEKVTGLELELLNVKAARETLHSAATEKAKLQTQVEGLLTRVGTLVQNLDTASSQVKDLSGQLAAEKQARETEAKNLQASHQAELKNLKGSHETELKNLKGSHETELKSLQQAYNERRSLAAKLSTDLDEERVTTAQLDKSLAVAVKEIELTRGEVERGQRECEGLIASLKESQVGLSTERSVNEQLSDEVRSLTARSAALAADLDRERSVTVQLHKELGTASKENARLSGDNARLTREVAAHPHEIKAMEATTKEAVAKAEKVQKQLDGEARAAEAARRECGEERKAKEEALKAVDTLGPQKDRAQRELAMALDLLDSERERTARLNDEIGQLRGIRDRFPTMQLEHEEALRESAALQGMVADLRKEMMHKMTELQNSAKAKYAQYDEKVAGLTASDEANKESVERLKKEVEQGQRDLDEERTRLAPSLKREIETMELYRETQDELERTRVKLQEEIARCQELASHSDNYQREVLAAWEGQYEVSAFLAKVCAGNKTMHDVICDMEGIAKNEGGVGVQIAEGEDGRIFITALLPGGSAEKGGRIKAGDRVTKVNGKDTSNMTVEQVRAEVVGCVGSPVTFGCERVSRSRIRFRYCTTVIRSLRGGKDDILESQMHEAISTARASIQELKHLRSEVDLIVPRCKEQVTTMQAVLDNRVEQLMAEKARDKAEISKLLDTIVQLEDQVSKMQDDLDERGVRIMELEWELVRVNKDLAAIRDAMQARIDELDKEKKALEMNIVDLGKEVAKLQELLAAEIKRTAQLKEDGIRRQRENEEAFVRNSKLNKELEKTKEELAKERADHSKTLDALSKEKEDHGKTRGRLAEADRKIAELEKQLAEANAKIAALGEEIADLKKRLEEEIADRLRQAEELKVALADVVRLSGENKMLEEKLLESNKTVAALSVRVEALDKEVTAKSRRVAELEAELKRLIGENKMLEEKLLESNKSVAALSVRLEVLDKEVMAKSRRVVELEDELKPLKEMLAKLRDQVTSLEKEVRKAVADRDAAFKERDAVKAELAELQKMYSLALADVQRLIDALRALEPASVGGLGMKLERVEDAAAPGQGPVVVKRLLEGGAAQSSGQIEVGDVVTHVDGSSLNGLSMDEVMRLIVGKPGSKVALKGERGDTGSRYVADMTRSGGGTKDGNLTVEGALQVGKVIEALIKALKEEMGMLRERETALERSLQERGRVRGGESRAAVSAQM